MLLNPRARLGPYEVVCDLGSGGVSRARDVGRRGDVTLRILQRHFAAGPDRVPFDRAVSLSRLKHPSIAAVYGIERVEADVHVLVTCNSA